MSEVTDPVSEASTSLAMVHLTCMPLPSGVMHEAVDVMLSPGAAVGAAKAGVANATSPTTEMAAAKPPLMALRTRGGRRDPRRTEFRFSRATRRIPPVPFVVANQG